MLRDVEEFRKLFRLPIPVQAHAAYYLDTLARSPEYADLPARVERFAAFEARLAAQGLDVGTYRQQQLVALREALQATPAFRRVCTSDPGPAPATRDRLAAREGAWMVSLDLREANFSVLKLHDDERLLGDGAWADWCVARGVDPVLAESKPFRQVVFGHLDPKRVQRLQHGLTAALADELRAGPVTDAELVRLSHDELIVALGDGEPGLARARALLAHLADRPRRPAVRATVFRSATLEPDISLRTLYDVAPGDGPPSERHRTLVGVPGNLFFVYFKRHVLAAPLDPRDLYFHVDGRLAQWVV